MEFGTALVHVPYQYQPKTSISGADHRHDHHGYGIALTDSDAEDAVPPDIKRYRRGSVTVAVPQNDIVPHPKPSHSPAASQNALDPPVSHVAVQKPHSGSEVGARQKRYSMPTRPHITELLISDNHPRSASATGSFTMSRSARNIPREVPDTQTDPGYRSSGEVSLDDESPTTPVEDYSWPPRKFQHPRRKNLELQREVCPQRTPVSKFSKLFGGHTAVVPISGTIHTSTATESSHGPARTSPVHRLRTSLERIPSRRISTLSSVVEDSGPSCQQTSRVETSADGRGCIMGPSITRGHRRWASLPSSARTNEQPVKRGLSMSSVGAVGTRSHRRISLFPAPFDPTQHTFRATVLQSCPADQSPASSASSTVSPTTLSRSTSIRSVDASHFPLPPAPEWPLTPPRTQAVHSPKCLMHDHGACHLDCSHPAYRPESELVRPKRRSSNEPGTMQFHYPRTATPRIDARAEQWNDISPSNETPPTEQQIRALHDKPDLCYTREASVESEGRKSWIREERRGSVIWHRPNWFDGDDEYEDGVSFLDDETDKES